jgi:photosystem II stability/assembly factor-like uncharacterized protein
MVRMPVLVAGAVALLAVSATAVTAEASGLSRLLEGHFVPVSSSMLPAGSSYDDATCPSGSRCYVVGAGPAGGVITKTSDSGRSWTSASLPATSGDSEFAIACPTASVCYVGAEDAADASAILSTRDGGATWRTEQIPAGSIVTSISCVSSDTCIAVGSDLLQHPQSTVLTTEDGATWVQEPSPARNFITVRCLDASHCWAAGPGAWLSSDLGRTWRDLSPPAAGGCPKGGGLCNAVYSRTIDIEFRSAADGWVVGGDQCGGVGVIACPGVAIHTTGGGAAWRVSPSSTKYPFGWQIACQGSACLYVGDGVHFSTIATTANAGSSWSQMQQVATLIAALACTPDRSFCLVAGGSNNVPALMTLGPFNQATGLTVVGSMISTVGGSLAPPAALLTAPFTALANALLAIVVILLVTFPSQLFNRTYEENHERIRRWWALRLGRVASLQIANRLRASQRAALSLTSVLLAGGVLAALLDPGFGLNLRSLALFIGAMLALVAGVSATAVAAGAYRRRRHKVGAWRVRALPSALLVAGACVLVSRLTSFQPGYLYGVIGGVVFGGHLTRREEGHEVAVASTCTLVVSIAAWLLWVPVSTAATLHPSSFPLALLEDFLATLFLSGMVGLLIGLVPLRFLPGERLAQWHWGAWALVFGIAVLSVLEVVVRPQTNAARGAVAPFWTTLGLFLAFGVASILFWGYFKVRETRVDGSARP